MIIRYMQYNIQMVIYQYHLFQHKCSTMFGSSGSPILNLKSNKLIGIHKQGALNYNIATFLNGPINEYINININN